MIKDNTDCFCWMFRLKTKDRSDEEVNIPLQERQNRYPVINETTTLNESTTKQNNQIKFNPPASSSQTGPKGNVKVGDLSPSPM